MPGEHLGNELGNIGRAEICQAIDHVVSDGLLRLPISFHAESHLLDVVGDDFPHLIYMSDEVGRVLLQGQGWTDEEIRLLTTGIDMAVIVLHQLVRRPEGTVDEHVMGDRPTAPGPPTKSHG